MKGKHINNRTQFRVLRRKRKNRGRRSGVSSRLLTRLDMEFPKKFRLAENFEGVAGAISSLRQLLGKQGARPPRIRLSGIATIDNAAALMLGAEVQAWNPNKVQAWNPNNLNNSLHFYNGSWNSEVRGLLTDMGLFPMLDFPRQRALKRARATDWVFMPVISDSLVDMKKFRALRESIESEIKGPMSMSARHYWFIGLSEAVTNAVQHAYEEKQRKQWWASASYNKATRELQILCYDRGMTIPKTLPLSGIWEQVRGFMSFVGLSESTDCDLIEGALRTRRTATKESHRGRGLPQLMNFIDEVDKGSLAIYSRKGKVLYSKSSTGGKGEYRGELLKKQIEGTLIEWSVFLPV